MAAAEAEVGRLIVRLLGDNSDFRAAIKQAIKETKEASDEIKDDLKDTEEAFEKLSKTVRNAGDRIKSFGKTAAFVGAGLSAAITAPLVILGNQSINAASDLKESMNAVSVVFGSAAGIIEQFGKQAAQTMGLSRTQFNELATTTGSLLQNLAGFSTQRAAEEMGVLAVRASDLASVFNTDVQDAMRAIEAALRGETEPIRRFGVSLDQAAIKAKALELGLATNAKELDRNAKTQAALAIIYEQTNRVAGDFANTSGDLANSIRIQTAAYENLKAQIGEQLLPMKMRLTSVVGVLVSKFAELDPTMQKIVIVAAGVAAAIGPLVVTMSSVAFSVGSIVSISPAVIGAVKSIGLAFTAMGVKATLAWAAATLGISLLITGLIGLGAILVRAQQKLGIFDPVIRVIKDLWKEIKQALTPVISELSKEISSVLKPVLQGLIVVAKFLINNALVPLVRFFGKRLISALKLFVNFVRVAVIPPLKAMAFVIGAISKAIAFITGSKAPGGGAAPDTGASAPEKTSASSEATEEASKAAKKAAAEANKLKSEVDKLNNSLQFQVDTFGKSSREVDIYKLQLKGATEAQLEHARSLDEALKAIELESNIGKLTDSLQLQIDTFGDSSDEIALYKFELQGATREQLKQARSLTATLNRLKEEKKARKEAATEAKKAADNIKRIESGRLQGFEFTAREAGSAEAEFQLSEQIARIQGGNFLGDEDVKQTNILEQIANNTDPRNNNKAIRFAELRPRFS